MKPEQITEALESAASQLGIKVRYETLPPGGVLTGGGMCRVRGAWNLFIDKKSSPSERIHILTEQLSSFDLSKVDMPPKIRQHLRIGQKTETTAAVAPVVEPADTAVAP
jgi:hypothetical protein